MNPITLYLVQHEVAVFFVYGLAFFAMGLVLAIAARRTLEVGFAQALRPLAIFGIAHGIHEWYQMFQKIAAGSGAFTPAVGGEITRLAILVSSFLMLALFGLQMLVPRKDKGRQPYAYVGIMAVAWVVASLVAIVLLGHSVSERIVLADVLARYMLGIPGALLASLALMRQQQGFRERGTSEFGRDLVWGAAALFLYGVVGQAFVQPSSLPPSTVLNSSLFLRWLGIPIQLFRSAMAVAVAVTMVRALRAFEREAQLRTEGLAESLRQTARELSWLLDLSNLLSTPMSLQRRLDTVLERIIHSLSFPDAGMILLKQGATDVLQVCSSSGLSPGEPGDGLQDQTLIAGDLARSAVETSLITCRHLDGRIFTFSAEQSLEQQKCRAHASPLMMMALPLWAPDRVIGSIVLVRLRTSDPEPIPMDEFRLLVGTVQQMGLSIEHARLYQEAQEREHLLASLLHQAVGAQESERQRIARELHDVTAQSLSAVTMGLVGVESTLTKDPAIATAQVAELKAVSGDALRELRDIIADLRPPQLDDLGLVPALRWYLQEFENRHGIPSNLVQQGTRARLPGHVETVLFRVAQEALTNVARHARASWVSVKVDLQPGQVELTVEDDGCGFEPQEYMERDRPGGWGLLGIQERVGLLDGVCEIDSAPGQGTRVRISAPLRSGVKDVQGTPSAG